MDKRVLILLAAFNGEKYIVKQIESILNQTYENYQLVISDDNSKDRTIDIIQDIIKKHDNVQMIVNHNNGSPRLNFNNLIRYALEKNDWDYVMFADQDDIWEKNKVELTLRKMLEVEQIHCGKPCLVYTNYYICNESMDESAVAYDVDMQSNSVFPRIVIQSWPMGCTMMLNRSLLEMARECPKEGNNHDEWMATIASLYGHITYIHTPTLYHIVHEDNATTRSDTTRLKNRLKRLKQRLFDGGCYVRSKQRLMGYIKKLGCDSPENEDLIRQFEEILSTKGYKTRILMKRYGFHGVNRIQDVIYWIQISKYTK